MAITRPKSIAPKVWAVYDLEWHPDSARLLMASVRDESGHTTWGKRGEKPDNIVKGFLEHVTAPEHEGRWLFAHAGGLTDVNFLIAWIVRNTDWKVEAGFSGSSAVSVTVWREGRKYHFGDSLWLMRDSLANLAKLVGMRKGANGDVAGFVRECAEGSRSWAELEDYNRHDNEILWCALGALENIIRDMGGELRCTLASTALLLFRSRYLTDGLETLTAANRYARHAYKSSRVERFRHYCESGHYYDVNSSFPHSMTFPVPGACLGQRRRWSGSELAIVKAKVRVPDMYIPPLPWRAKGGVYHPTGTWVGHFTGVDLLEAEAAGARIVKVLESVEFEPWGGSAGSPLRSYVLDLYERRKKAKADGQALLSYVFKILLNSLYGKLGEQPEKDGIVVRPEKMPRNGEMLMPGVWRVSKFAHVAHEHVAAPAVITARSRHLLRRAWQRAVDSGFLLWYGDTDSMVTDAPPEVIGDSGELGELKYEGPIREATFLAPKVYDYSDADGHHVKAKGFGRLDGAAFDRIACGGAAETRGFTRLRGMLRGMGKGDLDGPVNTSGHKRLVGKVLEKRCDLGGGRDSRAWSVAELRATT